MPTILLVDSDDDCRLIFRSALAHDGYRVVEASDGDEAARLLVEYDVHMVIGELYIRSHEGDLFVPALKSHPRARDLTVVVVSTQGFDDARLNALAGGADAFFVKPVELALIRTAVRRFAGAPSDARSDRSGRTELSL
ncbi:MAG TPA: response regulator [Gemmatimonadaceae bacterium]|nr:response regulator [Gemmatimonadaceae bacterium]